MRLGTFVPRFGLLAPWRPPGAASDRASRVQGVLHLFVIVRVIDAQTRPFWLVKFEGCYDVGAVDGLFLTDFFILPVE